VPVPLGVFYERGGYERRDGSRGSKTTTIGGVGMGLPGGFIVAGIAKDDRKITGPSAEVARWRTGKNAAIAFATVVPGLKELRLSGHCVGGNMRLIGTDGTEYANGGGANCSATGEYRMNRHLGAYVSAQDMRATPFLKKDYQAVPSLQTLPARLSIGVTAGY
jgi:hypothetical protein